MVNFNGIAALSISALLLSAPCLADEHKAQGNWTSKCTFEKIQLRFEAQSKSGDPYEDDMTIQIFIGKKKLQVPLGPALFWPMVPAKNLSACDKTVGIQISKDQFLLLFALDDRPALDRLAAILVDAKSGVVLDTSTSLGSFFRLNHEKKIIIEKTEAGFRSLMAQGWSKTSKTDSSQEILMGWLTVYVKDGKILANWEKPLPSTHSPYSSPVE